MGKSRPLFKITVLNWDKYNPDRKKSYKATLISNNFCHDNKLGLVPLTHRWLFLGILLTCGDHASATVLMNERQLRDLLESSKSIERALLALQSIQVLTFEKIEVSLNLIEMNSSEVKSIAAPPKPARPLKTPALVTPLVEQSELPVDPPTTLHWLAELWNAHVESLPKVSKHGKKRLDAIVAAVKKRPSREEWEVIVKNVEESDFLSGRDGKWTNCGFDWILSEANNTKIFEGNYRNKSKKQFTHQRENESYDNDPLGITQGGNVNDGQ